MKTHTNQFKTNIKTLGREIDSKITYTLNNEEFELGTEDLYSVTPHYEGSILKSVMKQLDVETTTDIPIGTEINYQFGLKVGEVDEYGETISVYEWLNFGNYIVYSSEKKEDTRSWKIVAYDKMLYAMKQYENVTYSFPMNVRSYIEEICTTLGLTFANRNDTFPNYNRTLGNDKYLDANGAYIGYTFRDALDDLSEVTASTICINADDELELRYITSTNDTIDEEYLKDVNVNFGEKYGPINSIVLSRNQADNVYLKDDQSVTQNGLCEIKIVDNQIMSDNDRSDYLPDILAQLDGIEYYLNDFSSTGIVYYDLCDRYNVSIDDNTYSCVMFNDEINITQGLQELIHTDISEQSETDYTKADKTDRKINQTYIMVDKQNQVIEQLVEQVVPVSNTITGNGSITLENAYAGTLHRLEITGNISSLLPSETLTPSNSLKPINITLIVDETTPYELDINYLNYTSAEIHDTYVYEDGKQWIERADGTIEQSDNEVLIQVNSDSTLRMNLFSQVKFKCTYLLENPYTDNFAPTVDLISKINLSPGVAEINANKISLAGKNIDLTGENITITSDNFSVNESGLMTAKGANIVGGEINLSSTPNDDAPKFVITNPNNEDQNVIFTSGKLVAKDSLGTPRTAFFYGSGMLGLNSSNEINSTFSGNIIQMSHYNDNTMQIISSETDAKITLNDVLSSKKTIIEPGKITITDGINTKIIDTN